MRPRVKPYQQGSLDSLCGVHAIINALQVLRPEMTRKDADKLFRVLLKEIARKGAWKVLWRGMDGRLFRHLLMLAIGMAAAQHALTIRVARPFAGQAIELLDVTGTLREALNGRCVAATMIHTYTWHWTVITKITEKSLLLFDSDGVKSIRIEHCSVRKAQKRHCINARELLLLRIE